MRNLFVVSLSLFLLFALSAFAADVVFQVRGIVVDASGRAIVGARVVLHTDGGSTREVRTDREGRFAFETIRGGGSLVVTAAKFAPVTVDLAAPQSEVRVVLSTAAVEDAITVVAPSALPTRSTTATKTDTPLRDVPQSVTVVTRETIAQQNMQGMADVVRYVPGVGIAQGEGNRDTPIFRGNSSTADFFVDGVRDDVQYFRDLYNVERVEALKGPNAMIFGRGGIGGVLNRVTRQADWTPTRELTLQGGSWEDRRVTGDFGQLVGEGVAARLTGMLQKSDSYREGARLDRYGLNPTVAFAIGSNTMLRAGYERFHDDRTADRGITSYGGRPVDTDRTTFFGNADLSNSRVDANVLSSSLDHRFSDSVSLRSRVAYGHYDKFYQNVYPGAVDASGSSVSISAYNNNMQRRNLFSQTDLVVTRRTGRFGHTILAGLELGRQATDNFRQTGFFSSVGANVTTVTVPVSDPTTSLPLTFRQSASDADNHGIARIAATYLQDQIVLSPRLQAVAGLRYDRFTVDFRNNRTGASFESNDGLVSPRLGLVYKPAEPVSLYASYSLSYLPRAGEQLSSLNLTNQSLDPEEYRNYEVGAKWELRRKLELAASVYRLDRGNVAVPDPVNPAVSMLVDGQRTEGIELSAAGNVTDAWSIVAAYAYQDGTITRSLSPTAQAGARLAQLPRHSASLWNKVEVSRSWGVGLGVIYRDAVFTSTDNSVTLPAFTRLDAALFYTFSDRLRAQVNVENLLNTEYYAFAHSNTNITPGAPRAVRVSWTTRF